LTLAGELPALAGSVSWLGETTTAPLHVRVRDGLAFVPEERILVMSLSVRENLKLGGVVPNAAVGLFAELGPLLDRRAGLLSGGEQQMLTLARALGRRPKAIIVDELSLGLAPQVAERLGQALRQAAESGLAVLVVEQNLRRAIEMSDRFYFMRYGHPIESRRSADYVDRADELAALLVPASLTN
jgi:ABC-type branched-subunit amino acid transport system ATPase component